MKHAHFRYHTCKLAYTVQGEGDDVFLAFHGFGQDAGLFTHLPDVVYANYKIIAIDLFGHGDSSFFNKEVIGLEDWADFIAGILEAEQVREFSVIGFSLGGRVAIATSYLFGACVKELVLLAPDGIEESIIYKLATRNTLVKKLFKRLVFKPWFYRKLVLGAKKMGLLEVSMADFFDRVLSKKSRRFKLYRIWNMYTGMNIPFDELVKQLNNKPKVYLAKNDKLVKNKSVTKVCRRLGVSVEVLACGHFQIVPTFFELCAKRLARVK